MASRPFLIAAAVIGAILAVLLLAWPEQPAPLPERILPGFSSEQVERVTIARPGQSTLVLERKDERFVVSEPVMADADPQAVRDVLGTLEMLAARRQEPGTVDEPRLIVTVDSGARPVVLRIAGEPGATDRVWLSASHRPGRALIDGYTYRALDVSVEQLIDWRPLRGAASEPRRIEVTFGQQATVIEGPPWRIELSGGSAPADPRLVDTLLTNLDRMVVEPYGGDPMAKPIGRVEVTGPAGTRALDLYPTSCDGDGRVVAWQSRRGCLHGSSWLPDLVTDPQALLDRHLYRGRAEDVSSVTIERDGRTLELGTGDDEQVLRRWLDDLERAGEQAAVASSAGTTPAGTITITGKAGPAQTIDILTQNGAILLRRSGEPIAWRLPEAAGQLVSTATHLYRSLDLLEFEPSRLQSVTVRQGGSIVEAIEVGETLETWRALAPPGASVDRDAANRLRDQLSGLRAVRVLAANPEPRHGFGPSARSIEVVLVPANPDDDDEQIEHIIIGDGSPTGGCYARLAADPVVFELPSPTCQTLTDPLTE